MLNFFVKNLPKLFLVWKCFRKKAFMTHKRCCLSKSSSALAEALENRHYHARNNLLCVKPARLAVYNQSRCHISGLWWFNN